MKQYKIQNRSQKNSQSCVPLANTVSREQACHMIEDVWWESKQKEDELGPLSI